MEKQELYSAIVCAMMHDLRVCRDCRKCGANATEIRMRLAEELAELLGVKPGWKKKKE